MIRKFVKTLVENETCIIRVDSVNYPTGIWWGTISGDEEATITGGRFKMKNGSPIYSDEHRGAVPAVNYEIFPDNEAVRKLFYEISELKGKLEEARSLAEIWEKTHKETMNHLIREGSCHSREDENFT